MNPVEFNDEEDENLEFTVQSWDFTAAELPRASGPNPRLGDPHPDQRRAWITLTLLIVSGIISVAILACAAFLPEEEWGRVALIYPILLTPFTTLLATAVGYFFFTRTAA